MKVTVEHAKLLQAVRALEGLADRVQEGVAVSNARSPVSLPTMWPLSAKIDWMRDQVPGLENLAALALLLDTEGDGSATFRTTGQAWDVEAMLRDAVEQRFGPDFIADSGLDTDGLREIVIAFSALHMDVPPETLMPASDLRALIIDHPGLARILTEMQPRPGAGGPEGTLASFLVPMMTGVGGAAAALDGRRTDIRGFFESLPPAQASTLAMLFPSVVADMSGVPFRHLAEANTVRIVVALEDERAKLDELQNRPNDDYRTWLGGDEIDVTKYSDLDERIALYESILQRNRQIVFFDPSGDGAIAELHGTIGPETDDVGVLVPGTNAKLSSFDGVAGRSRSFEGAASGDLAMISWLGGDLPDGVEAVDPSFARDLAPKLAEFSRDLEVEVRWGARPGTEVAFAGHSYGGAVVGLAEQHGLRTNRVLHIESAGMGAGVKDVDDLPDSQDHVDRYSMTAPGDPIAAAQWVGDNSGLLRTIGGIVAPTQWLGGNPELGHGADPDTFGDNQRLHTGDDEDGNPITGFGSHSGVFKAGSTSWNAMLAVFTDGEYGEAEGHRTQKFRLVPGPVVTAVPDGWNDDGETIDFR